MSCWLNDFQMVAIFLSSNFYFSFFFINRGLFVDIWILNFEFCVFLLWEPVTIFQILGSHPVGFQLKYMLNDKITLEMKPNSQLSIFLTIGLVNLMCVHSDDDFFDDTFHDDFQELEDQSKFSEQLENGFKNWESRCLETG